MARDEESDTEPNIFDRVHRLLTSLSPSHDSCFKPLGDLEILAVPFTLKGGALDALLRHRGRRQVAKAVGW